MSSRASRALGAKPRWLHQVVKRVLSVYPGLPTLADLMRFLSEDPLIRRHQQRIAIGRLYFYSDGMTPSKGSPESWPVPTITTVGSLADWFGLRATQLEWFADRAGLMSAMPPGAIHHYSYQWLRKRCGSVRLLESPKLRLRHLQRRILREILDHIPAHDAAHGFCKRRSIATYVAPHVAKRIVLRMDLASFFPSIHANRVTALFRTMGYPANVASRLSGLCTHRTPPWMLNFRDADDRHRDDSYFQERHLPQGAPTSPALANLCAFRLDCRLNRLAVSAGATYTRYADDLAFSGDDEFERQARTFHVHVGKTIIEEGFTPNFRKSRFMRQGIRQQLCGIVVNKRLNIARSEYHTLKAILTNCQRHGHQSQNRISHSEFRSYLEGRIAFVQMINPDRGQRLRKLFEGVQWSSQ